MFRSQPCTESAVSRGTIPQGKGREGIRKGREADRYRYAVCGLSLASEVIHRFGSRGLAIDKRMAADAAKIRGAR